MKTGVEIQVVNKSDQEARILVFTHAVSEEDAVAANAWMVLERVNPYGDSYLIYPTETFIRAVTEDRSLRSRMLEVVPGRAFTVELDDAGRLLLQPAENTLDPEDIVVRNATDRTLAVGAFKSESVAAKVEALEPEQQWVARLEPEIYWGVLGSNGRAEGLTRLDLRGLAFLTWTLEGSAGNWRFTASNERRELAAAV
ncbi:MAG: hypothetical protein AAGD38_19370 [Acidobacteriota bacterium]